MHTEEYTAMYVPCKLLYFNHSKLLLFLERVCSHHDIFVMTIHFNINLSLFLPTEYFIHSQGLAQLLSFPIKMCLSPQPEEIFALLEPRSI